MLESDVELTADDGVAVDNDVVVGAAALGSGHMPPEARSRPRETGVEVGEGSAWACFFTTRCLRWTAWLRRLVPYLTAPYLIYPPSAISLRFHVSSE